MKRGNGVEVIEDIVTLSKVNVSLKMKKEPQKVVLQPTGEEIPFVYKENRVDFFVKDFNCYQIIEIF